MWVVFNCQTFEVVAEMDSQQEAYDRWKIIFKRSVMEEVFPKSYDIALVIGMTSKQWTMWKLLNKKAD